MKHIVISLFAAFFTLGLSAQNTVIGVVNWDCSLPSNTYFGYYQTRSLSPAKYRYLTPYYADVINRNKIDYHWRDVDEYSIEMQYAIDAGIDYFAYCWYGEIPNKRLPALVDDFKKCNDNCMHELAYARSLHVQSPLRDKLKLCAIVVVIHPYNEEELDNLARTMKEDYYQKACGRPLVYLFGGRGDKANMTPRLRAACQRMGADEPYFVVMGNRKLDTEGEFAVQALSEYNDKAENVKTYAAQKERMIEMNSIRVATGMNVIPLFTTGFDPSPRIDNRVPWGEGYPEVNYALPATREELIDGGKALCDWIQENRSSCPTGHILTFAWNEFEEGGWLCPTWTSIGPDTSRIKTFRTITEYWRKNLDKRK